MGSAPEQSSRRVARSSEPLRYAAAVTDRRPVIIDCDPGHDDALALALALARPELDVLAITTVGGNAGLERTTRNALRVLALLGRSVPVAAGAAHPLVREPWIPVEFHGESGLDGADLPEPAAEPVPVSAVECLAAAIRAAPGKVTLVATGPLTNVALLLRSAPAVAEGIEEISLMGGSLGEGNTTASAEFNIWTDPEAAAVVFESGLPIRMSGLDITHGALMLPDDVARLDALGTRPGRVFADLMRFFAVHHRDRYGWDGPPIHDAVAVAWLVRPDLIESERLRVDVETGSGPARGRTIADREGLTGRPPNATVGLRIDRAGLMDLLVDAVASYGDGT